MGTALWAGSWLGMETPVPWIAIFASTIDTHLELFHRGIGAIVGQRFYDGETRSTVGAVGEGITKAPILRIENLAQTIIAGRDVRQNQRAFSALIGALLDFKSFVAERVEMG